MSQPWPRVREGKRFGPFAPRIRAPISLSRKKTRKLLKIARKTSVNCQKGPLRTISNLKEENSVDKYCANNYYCMNLREIMHKMAQTTIWLSGRIIKKAVNKCLIFHGELEKNAVNNCLIFHGELEKML